MNYRHLPAILPPVWVVCWTVVSCSAPRGVAAPASAAEVPPTPAEPAGSKPAPSTAPATSGVTPALPLPGGETPNPSKALPELRVEAIGMHVGGGKNDAQEKAPFHRALERQFPAFLDCYRLSEAPLSGGSFGIDLQIPRTGGYPSLTPPRTKMRGKKFQECMVVALGRTQFERPKAGPTVISYSVGFKLGK